MRPERLTSALETLEGKVKTGQGRVQDGGIAAKARAGPVVRELNCWEGHPS